MILYRLKFFMLQSKQIKYFIICLISVKSCASNGTEFRSIDYKKNNTLISNYCWSNGAITIIVFMIIFSLADSFLSSKFRIFNPLTGFKTRVTKTKEVLYFFLVNRILK